MKGKRDVTVLFAPTESTSLASFTFTKNHVVLNIMEHVRNRLMVLTPPKKKKDDWVERDIEGLPDFGTLSAWPFDAEEGDALWFSATDYVTPSSLWLGAVGQVPEKLKQTPAWFDASQLEVKQFFVTSKDGTQVPYFQVSRKLALDGSTKTLLYGYGGFEVIAARLQPSYWPAWLEKGGVYVVANIRGGGSMDPLASSGLKTSALMKTPAMRRFGRPWRHQARTPGDSRWLEWRPADG